MLSILEKASCSFRDEFSIKLNYASCEESIKVDQLSEGEFLLFTKNKCKHSFLRGRLALKTLCQKLSISSDTSLITFPNDNFSLTHAKKFAVAVSFDRSHLFKGIGIDLEFKRPLNDLHATYFLNEDEIISNQPLTADKLTQLWTIKEAGFKADVNFQELDLKKYHINFNNLTITKKGEEEEFVFKTYNYLDDFYFSICLKKNSGVL